MKYWQAGSTGPPGPRSSASLAQRTASMITPAELGESCTSSLSSTVSGTSPKLRPSRRRKAHLRAGGCVPLELELDGQRHVAEVATLEADERPLAIVEPRHVVGGTVVHVVVA